MNLKGPTKLFFESSRSNLKSNDNNKQKSAARAHHFKYGFFFLGMIAQ